MQEQPHPRSNSVESARAIHPLAGKLGPLPIGTSPRIEVTVPADESEGMRTSLLERTDSVAHRAVLRAIHRERLPRSRWPTT